MISIKELYLTLKTENRFNSLDEEKIFNELFKMNSGSLESAFSHIINETVLSHIHINIDSTIMQMLTINDYLIHLFKQNFEVLINNYILHYLELQHIEAVSEAEKEEIKKIKNTVDMKTDLSELIGRIDEKWALNTIKKE